MFPIFELFGREISVYGILSLIGAFACGIYICRSAKKYGYNDNDFIVILLISAIGVLIGGHILYGITRIDLIVKLFSDFGRYVKSFGDFINCMVTIFGGSVFYGGLLGGMAAGTIYCKKKKFSVAEYSDIIAPGVPLFHCFGRIGCFFGGCCYGIESSFGFTVHGNEILPSVNDVQRFPVQLLEASLNLILFFVLAKFLSKGIFKGKLFAVYLLCYSVIRFFDEFLRGDTYRGFLFGLSTSQIISIILFLCSLIYLVVKYKKRGQNQS